MMTDTFGKPMVLTVKDFTQVLKSIVEEGFSDLWIRGEISNFKDHVSGHAFFSLKDDEAVIKACLFKFNRRKVKFDLEDGLKVKAHGSITVYNKRGEYQIIVDHLEPEGIGPLQLAFQQLKERLEAEGLFDPQTKKPIPAFPERVAVITSPTGAAIRDILNIMNRRFSNVEILIYPAAVQGDGAGKEIEEKIQLVNRMGLADVLIVGRGGGSIEDLWAFNEEVVARAIHQSDIPIISAVGHEVDFSIADFVADLRAPTPSAAAELVVLSKEKILDDLSQHKDRMSQAMESTISIHNERYSRFTGNILSRLFTQRLNQEKLNLDYLMQGLLAGVQRCLDSSNSRFKVLYEKLSTLGPSSILKRGYSLVYLDRDNQRVVIRDSEKLKEDDNINIQFYKGKVKARVVEILSDTL